jgi:hypothetical protein
MVTKSGFQFVCRYLKYVVVDEQANVAAEADVPDDGVNFFPALVKIVVRIVVNILVSTARNQLANVAGRVMPATS